MKNCPSCGAANPDAAAFCSRCAFRFEEAGVLAQPSYPLQEHQQYPPPPAQQPHTAPPGQRPYPAQGYQYYAPGYPRYAGFWIRFAAAFIDGLTLYVLRFPLNLVMFILDNRYDLWGGWSRGEAGDDPGQLALLILVNVISIAIGWAYYVIMTGRYGATLGKMLFKLKVVREDMTPVSYGTAALREIVGKFLSGIVCAIGYIWAGFDDRKQAWHDKIAHTYVIITGP